MKRRYLDWKTILTLCEKYEVSELNFLESESMKFDPNLIREAAKEDFDKAWQQGREYLGRPALNERYPRNT